MNPTLSLPWPRSLLSDLELCTPLPRLGSLTGVAHSESAASALALGICILSLLLAAGCSKSSPAAPDKPQRNAAIAVATAKVEVVPLDRTLPVVGTLFPKDEATVGAQVEGQVQKTLVDFGDRVTEGQEIALIDTDSYQAAARQAAANLAKAQANLANAENNLKRIESLQKDKISSASDLDSATALAGAARAEVKAAEAASAIADLNLARSHVRAPFDGAVAERVASAGDYLKVGAPLFRLVNDEVLKYIVQAPERYAASVKKEQLVRFSVDAWPGECFEGKIYLISPSVSTATRAFNLGALVQNPECKLKANTFARGELVLERAVPTPVVPLEAIINFAGVTKVFVIENDAARSRDVQVGRVQDGRQEILAGLQPGDLVAVTGQTKLYEGAKIRRQTLEAKTALD